MKFLISCEFNIDTACVELKYSDGSMLTIDCDAVEDKYAKTIRQRSALDYLVYNAPLEYAELVLCGSVIRKDDELPDIQRYGVSFPEFQVAESVRYHPY